MHTQVCTLGWNHVPCYVTDLEIDILWVGRACAPPQPTPQIKLGLLGNKCQLHEDLIGVIPRVLCPRVHLYQLLLVKLCSKLGFSPRGLGLSRALLLSITYRFGFLIWSVLASVPMWSISLIILLVW